MTSFTSVAEDYLSFYNSFVKLVNSDSEYHAEAIERFRTLCEGRKLVANTDFREGSLLHLRLMDLSGPAAADNPLACINADLLREGYALLDRKNCRYLASYPQVVQKLQDAIAGAKRDRADTVGDSPGPTRK